MHTNADLWNTLTKICSEIGALSILIEWINTKQGLILLFILLSTILIKRLPKKTPSNTGNKAKGLSIPAQAILSIVILIVGAGLIKVAAQVKAHISDWFEGRTHIIEGQLQTPSPPQFFAYAMPIGDEDEAGSSTTTDDSGAFYFSRLRAGDYKIVLVNQSAESMRWSILNIPALDRAVQIRPIPFPGNQGRVYTLKPVHFQTDSAQLDLFAQAEIEKISNFIKHELDGKEWLLLVVGHCSSTGTNRYNLLLGGKRAKSVRDLLVSKQIPKCRILWISSGEKHLLSQEESSMAHAMNRRVAFILIPLFESKRDFAMAYREFGQGSG
ncbi:MAG: OmpA family protein [Desulfobacterales bacterium]|nr:OmpA family protein [Desulfobacterales bacterium]